MTRFKVMEVLKMKDSTMTGRTLADDLPWREANTIYLSYQGRRKSGRRLQGTPNPIRQDDENFVEVDT